MEQKEIEQKQLTRRNLIVLGAVIAVIAVLGVLALVQRDRLADDEEASAAYLVITVAGETYSPIRLDGEGKYTITRGDKVNVIEVTEDSICMHSSTCDNQDCVLQGTVTLENRSGRVLQNMILCLPNEVVLELLTESEARESYPMAFTEAADE